jgi:hypothetical protein
MLKRYRRWRRKNRENSVPLEIGLAVVLVAVLYLIVETVAREAT